MRRISIFNNACTQQLRLGDAHGPVRPDKSTYNAKIVTMMHRRLKFIAQFVFKHFNWFVQF